MHHKDILQKSIPHELMKTIEGVGSVEDGDTNITGETMGDGVTENISS